MLGVAAVWPSDPLPGLRRVDDPVSDVDCFGDPIAVRCRLRSLCNPDALGDPVPDADCLGDPVPDADCLGDPANCFGDPVPDGGWFRSFGESWFRSIGDPVSVVGCFFGDPVPEDSKAMWLRSFGDPVAVAATREQVSCFSLLGDCVTTATGLTGFFLGDSLPNRATCVRHKAPLFGEGNPAEMVHLSSSALWHSTWGSWGGGGGGEGGRGSDKGEGEDEKGEREGEGGGQGGG